MPDEIKSTLGRICTIMKYKPSPSYVKIGALGQTFLLPDDAELILQKEMHPLGNFYISEATLTIEADDAIFAFIDEASQSSRSLQRFSIMFTEEDPHGYKFSVLPRMTLQDRSARVLKFHGERDDTYQKANGMLGAIFDKVFIDKPLLLQPTPS